jgi:uncharacterized protein YfaS (alpha-2-macroglobulin family)
VINDNTDSPIPGAIVQRIGDSGEVLEEVTTDSQGRYTLVGLRRGFHKVRASAPNVTTKTRVLDIPNSSQADYIFALS